MLKFVRCVILCTLVCSVPRLTAPASTVSDSSVDKYNVRVGTQTFSGLYKFTTNNLLIETARAITNMGSDILKMEIASGYWGKYGIPQNGSINSLLSLVKSEPSCRQVFDMPFRRYVLWTYAFSTTTPDWNNGYTSTTDQSNDYKEFYDLTRYLLTNYNNSGKTFFLGHWEGDGYLNVQVNGVSWATNPPDAWTTGFVNYLNNRQKAIDDAKAATTFSNVNVFGYAECNRVRDAMNNATNNNHRMINYVIPYVTNLDYVSYSSYDMQRLNDATKQQTMDYIEAHLPTNKLSVITNERVWIGEYGYANAGDTPAQQEPETRNYINWLLNYGRKGISHVLFWEIYDNETNSDGSYKYFYLIDPSNNPAPCYFLHQRFLNNARLFVAQFKETNGRLPNDSEFVSLVTPQLSAPLPAPVSLQFNNPTVTYLSSNTAAISAVFSQGIYGADRATVSVYYGPQDGGTSPGAWQSHQTFGVYTNFNPVAFSATVSGLAPQTSYYYRFYATNASGDAWSPAWQFMDTSGYGSRLKLTFTGYNKGEALANFPVLVNLSTAIPGFSYRQFASPTGGDLRFTDANGSLLLQHEIDEWNPNGTSRVWVRIRQLATTNDSIWAYWGNPAATVPPAWTTNGSVWSSDHFLVWHLKETNFPYADSAAQNPGTTGAAPASSTGLIGLGESLNGGSQYISSPAFDVGDSFTLSAMVKLDTTATNIQTIWGNKPGGWNSAGFGLFVNTFNTADKSLRLETGDGSNGTTAYTASSAFSYGTWHHVAAVVDRAGGNAHLYIDGIDRTSTSSVDSTMNTQAPVNLGRMTNNTYYLKGVLDEGRIESVARSSNWIWAASSTASANSSFSTYSSITQRLPALTLTADSAVLHLEWPASGVGFGIFTTTNLTPPIVWSLVTNQPAYLNNQWQADLVRTPGPTRFYRLQAQ